jgi:hypothetical protein
LAQVWIGPGLGVDVREGQRRDALQFADNLRQQQAAEIVELLKVARSMV